VSTTIALEGILVAVIAKVDLVEGAILKGHHAVLASERHALLALLVLYAVQLGEQRPETAL